ncbi:hypothetical protein KY363_06800, partial [Candidatus Woesearchaeota archaeon]|nr:hypothetical protein [Candidatus Woesearchaeota archaeon]
MLIPIYAHGMWALLFFGGMTLYTLFRRKYISYNVWVLVLSLPIIIMTAWYLPGYMGVHGGAPQSDQEVYASEPSFFIDYLGFAIAIVAIAFIVYLVVKSARQKRFAYRFTELEILCLFWLLAMMPLMFTIIDRFCSYAAPPLALLGAGFLTRVTIKKPKAFIWSVAGIAVFSFAYQALLLWAFLLEGKHIFISNILKDYGIIPA